ncbi:tautomerase family protein [Rhizobium mesosinicum]|uniref:Tautomerase family protein n=1 Tax=Rhizobium mesosinicum TaxID=335017 RepID=A0ABS7GNU6_9HYPH|nr:tautomerase family protein [Rhizobium mesosinicum]MBW9051085.1 tautomerase family protein [Rhizobium mesosinicum]
MPLIKVHITAGWPARQKETLLDLIHEAVVQSFEVPETDRYQLLSEYAPDSFKALDTGLGLVRSARRVLVEIVSRQRERHKKEALYASIASKLAAHMGIRPEDLIVTIVTNSDEDWSFGMGRAQFLTGELI